MSHTKGPWHVEGNLIMVENACICQVFYRFKSLQLINYVETEANAHLIAAAPALLEALEDIIRCESYSYGDSPTWDRACDVIKKARGES